MQRPRDPADRRYWPLREGGTGQGFLPAGQAKEHHPYHYGTLSKDGKLHHATRVQSTHSMDFETIKATRQAVRQAARLASLKLLDRVTAEAATVPMSEAIGALREAGRLADVGRAPGQGAGQVINIGTLHLDALRARASARIANDPNALRALPSSDATITDSVTSGDVSDDSATG